MRDKRRPNVGASYRCSLALADEAFSQNTDLLPGFDERDDLLSDMPNENTWKGIQLEQRFVVKFLKKKEGRYVPEFVFQVTGNCHLFDTIDTFACRFLFQRN